MENATDEVKPNAQPKGSGFISGHALVIAIANYAHINPLPSAVLNDARDVFSLLTSPDHCGYDPQKVTLLLDEDATLDRLRKALESLANESEPDGSVTIFFSGHGGLVDHAGDQTSALLPCDCQIDALETTSLSEKEFSSALARIKSKRLVVFIDACHSGGAGSFKGSAGTNDTLFGYSEKSLGRLAEGTGKVLIASSLGSETSLVFPGARNSVFTQYLLAALRGEGHTVGDGVIRVFEIFDYLSVKVRNAVPGRQHPIFKASDLQDNFVVALDKGGKKSVKPILAKPTNLEPDRWKQLEDTLSELYPTGPSDQEIWSRAGGDLSRLQMTGTGRAKWFAALRTLRQGGGGQGINWESLVRVALDDFPHYPDFNLMHD